MTNAAACSCCTGTTSPTPDTTFWYTPGGGLEPGEDARTAAVRELREETGLRVEPDALVGPVHHDVAEFVFNGELCVQQQEYYLLDVPHFTPSPEGLDELEHASIIGFEWWAPSDDGHLDGDQVWPVDLTTILVNLDSQDPAARG